LESLELYMDMEVMRFDTILPIKFWFRRN
jgi:hypothetical protein